MNTFIARRRFERGFTLVELLVVIGIIALLVAILLPALSKARKNAEATVCTANIRTLSIALNSYATDSKSRPFPKNYHGQETLWLDHIGEYVGDVEKVRYCPTTDINPNQPAFNQWRPAEVFGDSNRTWIWNFDVTEYQYGSYGYNGWLYSNHNPQWKDFYWNTFALQGASEVPTFADCRWVDGWPQHEETVPANFNIQSGGNGNMIQRFLLGRHEEVLNVGFVDGHVEAIPHSMLWSLKWSKAFEVQGPQTRDDGSPIYP